MLKLKNKLLFIIGLFNGFVQASALLQSSEQEKLSPLMVAIQNDRADRLRLLLAAGANVNQVFTDRISSWTALMAASQCGHAHLVQILLAAGADVNQANADDLRETALMVASQNGHADVVKLLLAAGANVNQATVDGWTALMAASNNGHMGVVRLLLGADVNVDQATVDGWTALMYASQNGHVSIAQLIEQKIMQDACWYSLSRQGLERFETEKGLRSAWAAAVNRVSLG